MSDIKLGQKTACWQACLEWIYEIWQKLKSSHSFKKKSCSCNLLPSGGASVKAPLFSLPVDGADEHIWRSNQWIWSETDSRSAFASLTLVFLFAIQSSYFTLEEKKNVFIENIFKICLFCGVFALFSLFLYKHVFVGVFVSS